MATRNGRGGHPTSQPQQNATPQLTEANAYLFAGKDGAFPTREGPPITGMVEVKLTWDEANSPPDIVIHLSAFLVDTDSQVPAGNLYYCVNHNNDRSKDGSTVRMGRYKHGRRGNDEMITVDLSIVNDRVEKVAFVAYIQDGQPLKHTFSALAGGSVMFTEVGGERSQEFENHLLDDDYEDDDTAVIIGELIRTDMDDWAYRNIGVGRPSLVEVGKSYGVKFIPVVVPHTGH